MYSPWIYTRSTCTEQPGDKCLHLNMWMLHYSERGLLTFCIFFFFVEITEFIK